VYALSTDGVEEELHRFKGRFPDGRSPSTGLIERNGTFYGTTTFGGAYGDDGTIYTMSNSGAVKTLHNFAGSSDGIYPMGTLTDVKGTLYGTTYYDGGGGKGTCCGTLYALTL